MLAVLAAGRSYVPIDPGAPTDRQRFIIADARCKIAVAEPGGPADQLPIPVIHPAEEGDSPGTDGHAASSVPDFGQTPATAGTEPNRTDSEAYVLYTSGSTGTPKGVIITHRNARAFVRWAARAFPVTAGDQLAVHAPLHFDLPVYDIYAGLAGGATLHLVPELVALFPQALYRFLAERSISHLYAVPSALTALVNRSTLCRDGLPALRSLLYAGEEFRPQPLHALMTALPKARIANLYGPIETNVITSWRLVGPPGGDARVPIGYPVTGVQLGLLQEDGRAVLLGAAEGEIVVSGDCVSPGYLGRSDLTAASRIVLPTGPAASTATATFYRTGDFARRDVDGLLHLLGRRDGLVKTRGFRVELGEIESVVGAHPAVAEVAVVAEPDAALTNRLHALVVARHEGADIAGIIAHCRQRLPSYMIPSQVRLVADLPKTSTGKIARAELGRLLASTLEVHPS